MSSKGLFEIEPSEKKCAYWLMSPVTWSEFEGLGYYHKH